MLKTLQIFWLKKRAKRLYLRYHNLTDSLDCGMHMALMLRGSELTSVAKEFDSCINKLALLGVKVPPARLSTETAQ